MHHISLSIKGSGLEFEPGDAIGILPQNPTSQVDHFLSALNLTGDETFTCPRTEQDIASRKFLQTAANLTRLTTKMAKLLATEHSCDLTEMDPLELLHQIKTLPAIDTLAPLFAPLLPRFYSIASTLSAFPDEIHLTIAVPTFVIDGQRRYGIASSFLCHQATTETPISLYIQPAIHFTLPQDASAPLIMIGPGTGIAPFRAFIQEREAQSATGKHWIFFGERSRKTDFYYEEEWQRHIQENRLKLDLAFSRDQAHKIYVQDRLLENAKEVWQWIDEGACLYVCGDAKKMAKAVDATLKHIIQTEGKHPDSGAFLRNLRKQRRYLTDVY